MAQKLIIELQDDQGNIYYLHTVATAVFCTDGKTVQDKIGTVKGRIATKDSLKLVTEANYLVEAKAVRDCFDELNGKLTSGKDVIAFRSNIIIGKNGGNGIQFSWTGTSLQLYVDGTLIGTMTMR